MAAAHESPLQNGVWWGLGICDVKESALFGEGVGCLSKFPSLGVLRYVVRGPRSADPHFALEFRMFFELRLILRVSQPRLSLTFS